MKNVRWKEEDAWSQREDNQWPNSAVLQGAKSNFLIYYYYFHYSFFLLWFSNSTDSVTHSLTHSFIGPVLRVGVSFPNFTQSLSLISLLRLSDFPSFPIQEVTKEGASLLRLFRCSSDFRKRFGFFVFDLCVNFDNQFR